MKRKPINLPAITTITVCLCLLFGLTACLDGEENAEEYYQSIDLNQDDRLDTREFSSVVGYDDWDDNNDGTVDHNEFYDYNYGIWDEDDDGFVNEKEWADGIVNFTHNDDPDLYGDWQDWDVDNDTRLDLNEFTDGLSMAQYLDIWDSNGNTLVEAQEFRRGLFAAWDKNQNGYLEKDEYSDGYGSYFGS